MSTETAISHTPVPKPAAEDGSISWTAKTSANGVAYEVSVRNAAPSEAATVGDESYDVDWPVTGDNWVETEGDIHSRITHYKLMDATPSVRKWRLYIRNLANGSTTSRTRTCRPTRTLSCATNRPSVVRKFDSRAPTIKKVMYES